MTEHLKHLEDLLAMAGPGRVCREATLVSHINSYMGLAYDEFEVGFFQPGILLCMLCILLWALCVYKDRV